MAFIETRYDSSKPMKGCQLGVLTRLQVHGAVHAPCCAQLTLQPLLQSVQNLSISATAWLADGASVSLMRTQSVGLVRCLRL
jgi:hypothetical protein